MKECSNNMKYLLDKNEYYKIHSNGNILVDLGQISCGQPQVRPGSSICHAFDFQPIRAKEIWQRWTYGNTGF